MLAALCMPMSANNKNGKTYPEKEHETFPIISIPRAFIIGDFNNWQLPIPDENDDWSKPQTENLNGALCLIHDSNHDTSYYYVEYKWEGIWPAGDSRFTVYIPEIYEHEFGMGAVYPGYYSQNMPVYLYSHIHSRTGKQWNVQNEIPTYVSVNLNPDNAYLLKDWSGGNLTFFIRTYTNEEETDLNAPRELYPIGVGVRSTEGGTINEPDVMHFVYKINGEDEEHVLILNDVYDGSRNGLCYRSTDEIHGVKSISGYFTNPQTQQTYGCVGTEPLFFDYDNIHSHPNSYFSTDAFTMPDGYPINLSTKEHEISIQKIMFTLSTQRATIRIADDKYNSVPEIKHEIMRIEQGVVQCTDTSLISVYNTAGVKVAETYGSLLDLNPLGRGIYLVRSGSNTIKVVI